MQPTTIIGGTGLALGFIYYVSTQIVGEIRRVRTAVLAAAPEIGSSLGAFAGGRDSGLHANIKNTSTVRAHDLELTFPGLGVVWKQPWLEKGDVVRPYIPIPDNAALYTEELTDPVAVLSFNDKFGFRHELRIPLWQQKRDDGKFNLGAYADRATTQRPELKGRQLWKMRKRI